METQPAANNDKVFIQDIVKSLLQESLAREVQRQLAEQSQANAPKTEKPDYGYELFERVVRVEEELKHQRELLQQNQELLKIFMQQVDKRFEIMQQNMDKRFLMLQWFMGIGFGLIISILGLLKFL